uniref:2-oxoglutarate and iron-dependent oxygenase domain containing 2 n=1 Tax=Cyprinus carpio TaxID=7962 RepID=A0A8C2AE69_CYPCA
NLQQHLMSLGCVSKSQFRDVLGKVSELWSRNHSCHKDQERAATIREIYAPLHQHVYHLQETFLSPEFLQLVKYCTLSDAAMEGLMKLIQTDASLLSFQLKSVNCQITEEKSHQQILFIHHVTEGLLHRGLHMHGALPIYSGTRWNLIIWMRASREMNKLCPMCGKRPTLVESDGFSDGFTMDPDDTSSNVSCSLT